MEVTSPFFPLGRPPGVLLGSAEHSSGFNSTVSVGAPGLRLVFKFGVPLLSWALAAASAKFWASPGYFISTPGLLIFVATGVRGPKWSLWGLVPRPPLSHEMSSATQIPPILALEALFSSAWSLLNCPWAPFLGSVCRLFACFTSPGFFAAPSSLKELTVW